MEQVPRCLFFGGGYVNMRGWRKTGALTGVINLVIALVIGGLWWKVIGGW